MWIELKDIHKHYGKVKANNGVSFTVHEGSIHGVLGENGAGKSTLMKVLAGYSQKTSGSIIVDQREVSFKRPGEASALGIGMLYQDPMDFPLLTVLENFMLGQTSGIKGKRDEYLQKFNEIAETLSFGLDPDTQVKSLTVGERQQLEIIRLLSTGVQVLILDEPTTGITDIQKSTLFAALKKLAFEGKSVILVSHKLEDVESLCDRITVLREGEVTGNMESPFDTSGVLTMMFDSPPVPPSRISLTPGNEALVMKNITAIGGRSGLKNCNIEIRENEVVGLAGLEGSGQGVFLRVAAGLRPPVRGSVSILGKNLTGKQPIIFKDSGVTFLPTSRLEDGLVSGLNISEHFALNKRKKTFFVKRKEALQKAKKSINKFRIKGRPLSTVESLSGGNQQRLLLSFIPKEPELLLLENPTRGLDLESAHWVWEHLQKYCKKNRTSLVFSSAEIDEILMVADRVLVFFEGEIIKDVKSSDTDVQELGRALAGKI